MVWGLCGFQGDRVAWCQVRGCQGGMVNGLDEGGRPSACATNAQTNILKQKKSAADRDVDSWTSTGCQGSWVSCYRTALRSFFTSYKVAVGIDRETRLK